VTILFLNGKTRRPDPKIFYKLSQLDMRTNDTCVNLPPLYAIEYNGFGLACIFVE